MPSSLQGKARLTSSTGDPNHGSATDLALGDTGRIRRKTLKIAPAPEDQGIATKDHAGLETKEGLSEAQEAEAPAERGPVSILVKF